MAQIGAGYQGLDVICLGSTAGFMQALRDELNVTVQQEDSDVLVVRTRRPKVHSS